MSSPKRKAGRHRIYMNVGYLLTEEQLRGYFSHFGPLLDVYLPKHKSGRNKGFGFTTFEHEPDLDRVLRAAEHVIDGVVVKINKAGPRPEYEATSPDEGSQRSSLGNGSQQPSLGEGPRIYVGGIPDEVSEEELREHFCKWGAVVDIYFPGKKGQKRVNYCFVTFDHWRAAHRACNESERNIKGKALQSISIAEERLAEQRADSRASANAATALASFLNCAAPLAYSPMAASHPLSVQALAQQLSGLSFYTQRPADAPHPAMYNGLLPAAPVHSAALLDGLQPSEAGYLAQPLIPSVHAMHAAAMQQAQISAQLAAGMAPQPLALDPSLHQPHPDHWKHTGLDGTDGHRPTWAWQRMRTISAAAPRAAPASYEGHSNSASSRSQTPLPPSNAGYENGHISMQNAPPLAAGTFPEGASPAPGWYPEANGHGDAAPAVSSLANGYTAEASYGSY